MSRQAQFHQGAGRVVNENEKRAGRAAIFEPAMIRAVDLDHLTIAFPAQARLMKPAALLA